MRELVIRNFDKGVINSIESYSIPEEASSDSLNWLTKGDKIELSGGYELLGDRSGVGRVSGLHVGEKADDYVVYKSCGKKLYYLDTNWIEIGTDILDGADNEDVSFTNYASLAGYQTWVSSPNSTLLKIMNANPADAKDMYDASKNFKGFIDAQNNRIHLWNRDKAKNYLYGSWKDLQDSTVYTSVNGEAVGASGSTTYSGTLAQVSGKRTCFNVVFTDGTQTLQDDKDGNLIGDGTGTINYATGAYSITFNNATTSAVTVDYQWEDSTNHGLADFTFSTPRVAGEGYFLPQNTGGDLLNVLPYSTEFYCLHEKNAYLFSMPVDDENPTNQVWRRHIGIPNWRCAYATGEGIYYIDTSEDKPKFKIITLAYNSDKVIPRVVSYNLDLDYNFSRSQMFVSGDYVLFSASTNGNYNDRLIVYNKIYKTFDITDYITSHLTDMDGTLIAGDEVTNNVYKLFYGYTADDAIINNYWIGKLTQLKIDEIKKIRRLTIEGDISRGQTLEVWISYDRNAFEKIGEITGTGSYVDTTASTAIGINQIGINKIGATTTSVYHYRKEFEVNSTKFDEVQIKFIATNVGYVSVSTIDYFDIKTYGQKNILRYK